MGPSLELLYFQPVGISGSLRSTLGVVHCVFEVVESFFAVDMAYCDFEVAMFGSLNIIS
jgi:hypothetical protein